MSIRNELILESVKTGWESYENKVKCDGDYELRNILGQGYKVDWPWHLNIDHNDKAMKTAERFHQSFKNLTFSSSIADQIPPIEEEFSKFKTTDQERKKIA
jgi:hypothetical protein